MCSAYSLSMRIPSDVALSVRPLEFEGKMFSGMADAPAYLESVYGDWKQVPTEEKRVNHAPLRLVF